LTRAIIDWLTALGIGPDLAVDLDVPIFPGPYVPDMPDRIAVVTTIPGPGDSMQGIADTPGFQLLIRGLQDPTDVDASAEEAALAADRLIRFAPPPALVGDTWLLPVTRSGGRPAPIPQDDGDRITFTCTYLTPVIEETG
jgi:hypothetical protein